MVAISALWLPILISAVIVFIVSSIIHTLLTYHASDFGAVPDEDAVMDALRPFNIPPGDYVLPHAGSMSKMKSPEHAEKAEKGPVAMLTIMPNGIPGMGQSLVLWFLYSILISLFSAYITGRALEPGAHYLSVFRFVGAASFAAYGLGLLQNSIWYHRSWSATLKSVFDAFVYSLLTAGTFGWLWPKGLVE